VSEHARSAYIARFGMVTLAVSCFIMSATTAQLRPSGSLNPASTNDLQDDLVLPSSAADACRDVREVKQVRLCIQGVEESLAGFAKFSGLVSASSRCISRDTMRTAMSDISTEASKHLAQSGANVENHYLDEASVILQTVQMSSTGLRYYLHAEGILNDVDPKCRYSAVNWFVFAVVATDASVALRSDALSGELADVVAMRLQGL
jgi:hypothetical protein